MNKSELFLYIFFIIISIFISLLVVYIIYCISQYDFSTVEVVKNNTKIINTLVG